MKKALSAVLALLMILSCMVFPIVAEEATAPAENKIVLSNCDTTTGWATSWKEWWPGNTARTETLAADTTAPAEGTGSIATTVAGGNGGSGRLCFQWATDPPMDISKMVRIAFDLYLSDASLANLTFELELRSPGGGDSNEFRVSSVGNGTPIKNYFIADPVVGWNRVELPFAAFTEAGTFDKTQLRYFKLFLPANSGTSVGVEGTNYTVKLDNVHFTDRKTALETVEGIDVLVANGETLTGWAVWQASEKLPAPSQTEMDGRGKVISYTYTGKVAAGGGWNKKDDETGIKHGLSVAAVDVSDMKYFVFDMYISNPTLIQNTEFLLELTSGGGADREETSYKKTLEGFKGSALKKGWNRFYVDLSALSGTTGGTTDWTRWNYMRFHNNSAVDLGTNTLTLAWDNIGFAKAIPVPEKPESVKPTLISITNGDQLDGFATGDRLVLDMNDPSQGKASIARIFDGVVNNVAAIKFEYTVPNGKTYDATLMNQLCFDVWVSDPAAFDETQFELEIYGKKDGKMDGDAKEIVKRGTLADFKGSALEQGWNHIAVDINAMTNKGANMAEFCWFRLFMRGGAAGIEGQTSTIKLDNIYMPAEPVVYTDKIPLLMIPSGNANNGVLNPAWGSGTYMNDTGNNYNTNTIDITGVTYFEFDVKIGNAIVNDISFRFDITSDPGHDCDTKNRITSTLQLKTWAGSELPVNEWVHVKIPLSLLTEASAGGTAAAHDLTKIPNLKKVAFIRFFANQNTSLAADNYGCEMKNFCLTKELEGGEELIFDAETLISGKQAAQYKGGTTGDITLNSFVALRDIDGDGDNEWVAQEKAAAGSQASAGGLPVSFKLEQTVRNAAYANMYSLRFDLYCNDEKVLNHNFDFELSSSGGSDVSEITKNMKLSSRIVADLGNDWYTIEVPLSVLTGACNGAPYVAPKAAFSANRFNFFRMFASGGVSWDAGLVMAVDNVYVVRTAAEDAVEPFEIPAGAIPFGNTLHFVDLNSGNNYFHGATTKASATAITPNVVDASVYNLLCGILYLENYDEIAATGFCFEITSAGTCDKEESSIPSAALANIFTRFDGQPLQDGNNYVYLDVVNSTEFNSHAADLTRVNFIRIFNQTNVLATKDTTAKLSDLFFANDNILNTSVAQNMEISGTSLNINDNVSLNVIANIHPSLTSYSMTMTMDGVATEVKGTRIGATNQVVFTTPTFQENELAKTFTFELIAKTSDGKVLTSTLENYSVKQYVVDMLDGMATGKVTDTDGGELSALLTDLLVYAAAVQKHEGETELVTDGVDLSKASTFVPMSVYNETVFGEQGNCPAEHLGYGRAAFNPLEDSIHAEIVFAAESVEGLKLKVAVGAGEATVYDKFIDKGEGIYAVDITMRAFEIGSPYTCYFEGYEGYVSLLPMATLLMESRDAALEALAEDPTNAEAQATVELVEAIACFANSMYNYAACQQ